MTTNRTPTEYQEMRILAAYLNYRKLKWCHPVNEGKRSPVTGRILKSLGLKAGVPDILIFNKPNRMVMDPVGMAIELKRQKGSKPTDMQNQWMDDLAGEGWLTRVCYGATEAIRFVEEYYA